MKLEATDAKCFREPHGQNKPRDELQSPRGDRPTVPVGGGWCRGLVPSLALLPGGRVASVPQFPACHVEAVL